LRLAELAEHLAEIVDEAGRDHPARLVRAPCHFRRLQRVIHLRERRVRIALVDDVIESSSICQTVIRSRFSGRYSAFFALTNASVWF